MTAPESPTTPPGSRYGLLRRLRRVLPFKKTHERITIILNPAAGQSSPTLRTFNRIFHDAGFHWEIRLINQFGDGQAHARKAVAEGADIVAVYGGDGSVMDVAAGMIGSQVPLGILPGGTGNIMAGELGIPRLLTESCHLLVNPDHTIRTIDGASANDTCFLMRAGIGLEATIVKEADRETKDFFGMMSYAFAIIYALNTARPCHYQMNIDGKEIEIDGLLCTVANAGYFGLPGLVLSPTVSISDGLLDVFVIRQVDLLSFLAMATRVVGRTEDPYTFPHWQGTHVVVTADPPQDVEADGELISQTPVDVSIIPGALRVIVP
jgi:diacylglycerol kinase (ATP)